MPIVVALIVSLLVLLYTVYLFIMRHYWVKATKELLGTTEPKTTVAVIIPFRNEATNLPHLIICLNQQLYPTPLVKFVLVNDHSDDDGFEIAKKSIEEKSQFLLVGLDDKNGKKSAIRKGISSSQSELIITIDADVSLKKQWLQKIVSNYEQEKNDMTILPVMFSPVKNFFHKLQQTDFFNLAGLTGASAKMNNALMCNGSNLCYTRKAFEELSDKIDYVEIPSGDDMFLLLAMKCNKKKIGYYFTRDVIARTAPSESIKAFLAQRVRWASKARFMKDGHIIFSGLLITLTNIAFTVLLTFLALGLIKPMLFLALIGIKSLVDFIYVRRIAFSFGEKTSLLTSLALTAIYPIYVLVMPLLILFFPPKWKGRRISLRPNNS